MNPWAWIAAYVVGFALLQLLLYRYLSREVQGAEATTPISSEGPAPRASGTESASGDAIVCRHCGAENEREQGYKFCRACAEPLR
jgi:hypothetical protein